MMPATAELDVEGGTATMDFYSHYCEDDAIIHCSVPEAAAGQHVEDLLFLVAVRKLREPFDIAESIRNVLTLADGHFQATDVTRVTQPCDEEHCTCDVFSVELGGEEGGVASVVVRNWTPPGEPALLEFVELHVPEGCVYVGVGDFLIKNAHAMLDAQTPVKLSDNVAERVTYSVSHEGRLRVYDPQDFAPVCPYSYKNVQVNGLSCERGVSCEGTITLDIPDAGVATLTFVQTAEPPESPYVAACHVASIEVPEPALGQHVEDLLFVVAQNTLDTPVYSSFTVCDEVRSMLTVADGHFTPSDVVCERAADRSPLDFDDEEVCAHYYFTLALGGEAEAKLRTVVRGNSPDEIVAERVTFCDIETPEDTEYYGVADFVAKCASMKFNSNGEADVAITYGETALLTTVGANKRFVWPDWDRQCNRLTRGCCHVVRD